MRKTIKETSIKIERDFFPEKTVGIDMGNTLTKFAYPEGERLNLSMYHTENDFSEINRLIKEGFRNFDRANFTGGKCFDLSKEVSDRFKTKLLDEFQSNAKGIDALFSIRKKEKLSNYLLITIGTGTSITLRRERVVHAGGTAIGGSFFMGLSKLLFGASEYDKIISLAQNGNKTNVDLKVSDIYDSKDDRIDSIFREFTAASLGKINALTNLSFVQKEDVLNSILNVVGENIGLLSCSIADKYNVKDLLFCGGFTQDNGLLKRILSAICRMNNKKAIFLKDSEFCGALGALLF